MRQITDPLSDLVFEKTIRAESLSAVESIIREQRGWKLRGSISPHGKKFVATLVPQPAQLKAMVMSRLDVDYKQKTFMGQTALLEPVYHKKMIEYQCDFVFKLEGFRWAVLTGKNAKEYNNSGFAIVNVECGQIAVDDASNLLGGVEGLLKRIDKLYGEGGNLKDLVNKSKSKFSAGVEPYIYALFL